MRQTNVSFGLILLGQSWRREENEEKKRKKRKKREKKWAKTKKVCFHFGIMCILDS